MPERYVPKKVGEVKSGDKRVAIVGKVIEKSEDAFVIEDDSGKIEVFFSTESDPSDDSDVMQVQQHSKQDVDPEMVKHDTMVRVFCTVAGDRLNLDAVQDLTGLDINLLKTTEELYSKAGI
jgi:hypothetical protein